MNKMLTTLFSLAVLGLVKANQEVKEEDEVWPGCEEEEAGMFAPTTHTYPNSPSKTPPP